MHVLVTRSEQDAQFMAGQLEALGHRVTCAPLIEIRYETEAPISLAGVQALVVTSRNGLRGPALRPLLAEALALPLFAVGPGTAEEARSLGFSQVFQGPASARDIVPLIAAHTRPQDGALLHLAGDVVAFDLKAALENLGYSVRQETIYRSVAAESLPPNVAQALSSGSIDGVVLMSARTAAVFAKLVTEAQVADTARRLKFFCLSQSVAASLDTLAPFDVVIAALPTLEEMLALVAREAPESS